MNFRKNLYVLTKTQNRFGIVKNPCCCNSEWMNFFTRTTSKASRFTIHTFIALAACSSQRCTHNHLPLRPPTNTAPQFRLQLALSFVCCFFKRDHLDALISPFSLLNRLHFLISPFKTSSHLSTHVLI